MQTMWKGSISFGLVNIPVKMFTATEDKDVRFRQLHKEDHSPIKYIRSCPNCGKELANDEIVKGYEYQPGEFVIMNEDDFKAIAPEASKSIEIIDFVDLKEIDPIFYDKTYYLAPNETGDKAYTLLRNAMKDMDKIAIAKIIIRDKESLAVVRIYKQCIVLETIFYPDEIRSVEYVPGVPKDSALINDNELKMAKQIIENLSTNFEPEKYTNEYRQKLLDLIESKVEGKNITKAPVAAKNNVVDLMSALQASLEETQKRSSPKEQKSAKKRATKKEKDAIASS
ncbi:Ku protein [Desulfuribacillus stibiiarsenatis]|uniref:Non-homologous end joining protein Ku n=1 Tax=Desulfuribacillus stibiiarsenatis TaxID=1390249 RepID=A0A1E5L757_9FIRM|nr:Ku protein [Desulfuribacillus stibiiarsenatis]OEH85803.1 Ku protein [Desulfuribacillus stibiiarsenatis]